MKQSVLTLLLLLVIVVGGGAISAPTQQRSLLTRRSERGNSDEDEGSIRKSVKLVVNHLPKCGGLFIRAVLSPDGNVQLLKFEREQDSVEESEKEDDFVVGMVRNPLDYYISHWAFVSSGDFSDSGGHEPPSDYLHEHYPNVLSSCKEEGCVLGETSQQKTEFNRFVRTVCTESIGQMSLRFWGSYVGSPPNGNFHNCPVAQDYFDEAHINGGKGADLKQTVLDDLGNLSSLQKVKVDCWTRQESLDDDLVKCLKMYEKKSGHGKLDWDAIKAKMNDPSTTENSVAHAGCKDLYEEETLKLVAKADKHLFDWFGYKTHCS